MLRGKSLTPLERNGPRRMHRTQGDGDGSWREHFENNIRAVFP
jgi:hypothetical protein